MCPELNNVLQCISLNGYSVLSLISDILAHGSNREDRRIEWLLEGVERDAVDSCARLLNHTTTSTSVSTWALGVALRSQARNGHGPHFMTGHPPSVPNVSQGFSFATASTPTDPPEKLLSVRKARCTCSSSGVVTQTRSDSCTVVKYKRTVIIDPLPDDIFLEIFDLCLRDPTVQPVQRMTRVRMKKWIILVHVCQRWRRIIFASPCRLDLYVSCICGTPVRQDLVYWPLSLPLVIDYPGPVSFPNRTSSDDDNILAALAHANRIHFVDIYATPSLFDKVTAVMQEPFPVLTRLELKLDQEEFPDPSPVLPWGLLGGSAPRLEFLSLSGVSFPSLPTFPLSASNLLTLILDDILQSIPPETMVAGLAVLTRLSSVSLSIAFDWEIHQPDQWEKFSNLPMPTVLPALAHFHYKGDSAYLEDLLALIDTPLIDDIWIEYFMEDIPVLQLSQFIGRTKNLKDTRFSGACLSFYDDKFNIEPEGDLTQEAPPASIALSLLGPAIYVPDVVDVVGKFIDTVFPNIGELFTYGRCLEYDLNDLEWLPFLRLFPAVEKLHLSGKMVPCIASVLEDIAEEMLTDVMPALHLLWLDDEKRTEDLDNGPIRSIEQFLSFRQLSGRPVTVVNARDKFNENTQGPSETPR